MPLFYPSELLCLLLFHQEHVDEGAGEATTTGSENSSRDGAGNPHGGTERLLDRGSPPLGAVATSDEDDSEYEDCREEEEEVWQTCSEEDSNPDEEACGWDRKERCAGDCGAQGRGALQKRHTRNFSHLVSRQELLEIFKQLHTGKKVKDGQLTVGLVR